MKPIPLEVSSLADDETFRAPDLVWYQLSPGVWGFIVLLSSAEQPYKHVRLVRFTEDGKRVTSDTPDVDIRGLMKEARRRENNCPHDGRLNWEGLGWFNELHTRLILIHDVEKKAIPCALVVDIPEHWIRN